MAKFFSTINELWDYCSFCPMCQGQRQISILVGPDDRFTIYHYTKSSEFLVLECGYSNSCLVKYEIDCCFKIEKVVDTIQSYFVLGASDQEIKKQYFYFYLQSGCENCSSSAVYGSDIEFNHPNKYAPSLSLEREDFVINECNEKIHISLLHGSNQMIISTNCGWDDYIVDNDEKGYILPIMDLDFSDRAKLIEKLKTLILFS